MYTSRCAAPLGHSPLPLLVPGGAWQRERCTCTNRLYYS